MPTLPEAYRFALKDVVSGAVTVNEKGQFFANEPRLSLIISGFQMDECGISCQFIHLPRKRNGHFFILDPSHAAPIPEWDLDTDEGTLGFIEKPNEHLLAYSHPLFIPLLYTEKGGITFAFDQMRDGIREQLALISRHQQYTLEWHRYVCSQGKGL